MSEPTKKNRMLSFRLDEISLVDNPAQAPARVAILKRQGDNTPDNNVTQTADSIGKDSNMADTPKPADELIKAEEKIQEVTKAYERATSILALKSDERAHFDSLSGDEADAFLSKSTDERGELLKNAADADPVVFTDGDIVLRKSADPTLLALAKSAKKSREDLAAERAVTKQASLEKRAAAELPNLRGENVAKAALIGAVDSIGDETVRGQVTEMLKAHDAGLGKAFERVGTTEGNADAGDAEAQLDALAKAYATKHDVSFAKASVAVLETPEGAKLYASR